MALRTADEYREGLRDGRKVFIMGKQVRDVTQDPYLKVGVETAAFDFLLAETSETRELVVMKDPRTGEPVSAYFEVPDFPNAVAKRHELLTGASRGLGPYIASSLAREGVNLTLTARAPELLETTAGSLAGLGIQTTAIPANITDQAAREDLLERALTAMGKIDILINNAGVEWVARYTDLPRRRIETMIQTNFVAPLVLARMVLPDMLKRGGGHIVMISSLGGRKGVPYSATYGATKAGLIEWTNAMREELRHTGVGVSTICPGFVKDAGMFAVYGKRAPKFAGETTPEKVAAAVVRAIRDDIREIAVSPGPIRLMTIANVISPSLMSWMLRAFGLYDFYRRQAEENQK